MKLKKEIIIELEDYEKVQIAQVQDLLYEIKDLFNDCNIRDDYKVESIIADLETIKEDFQHYLVNESEE